MIDLDDVKGNQRDRRPTMGDLTRVFKFPEKKWVTVRLRGGMQPEAGYWVKTKKKDGKSTKFFTPCPSFDSKTQERDSTKYDPWRDLQLQEKARIDSKEISRDEGLVQYASHFWMEGIVRSEQKKQPRKLPKPTKGEVKSGFKDKDSDTWTPVFVIKIGRSLAQKLKELKSLNVVESKKSGSKAFSVADEKYGRDVRIYFDGDKAPADQYQVQLGDKRTPLSEEELAYLGWDMSQIDGVEFDKAEVKADFTSWATRNKVKLKASKSKDEDEDDDQDDDDEDDDKPSKGKKSKKAKPDKKSKGKKPKDEDDDEDDEDEDDDSDFDDDEDDEPKKGKKSKGKKSKDEDDEDEDSDDEDDEDSDDEDSDDDEDEDSDDEDDEDSDEDDEDSDDEDEDSDDDEDDEDEKPKKGKGKSKDVKAAKGKKAKGKKSKDEDEDSDFDDEDEDSDDEDEDDDSDFDDEDEKPKKGKKGEKSKPAKGKKDKPVKGKKAKPSKGKKSKDEDDDLDF